MREVKTSWVDSFCIIHWIENIWTVSALGELRKCIYTTQGRTESGRCVHELRRQTDCLCLGVTTALVGNSKYCIILFCICFVGHNQISSSELSKGEVAVLGLPLIVHMVSEDVKQHWTWTNQLQCSHSPVPPPPHALPIHTVTGSIRPTSGQNFVLRDLKTQGKQTI